MLGRDKALPCLPFGLQHSVICEGISPIDIRLVGDTTAAAGLIIRDGNTEYSYHRFTDFQYKLIRIYCFAIEYSCLECTKKCKIQLPQIRRSLMRLIQIKYGLVLMRCELIIHFYALRFTLYDLRISIYDLRNTHIAIRSTLPKRPHHAIHFP